MNEYVSSVIFTAVTRHYNKLSLYGMKKTLYIFCGDYLERGIENKEMMYEMMRLSTLPNTIMLEGNHERHIANFAFNSNLDHSKRFMKEVVAPIVKDMTKKRCRITTTRITPIL